jgi:hypothetical protein
MKTLIVAAAAALLSVGTAAHAAQIASPVIFGGHFQEVAECVVLNADTKPVTIGVKIVDDAGTTVASGTCDGQLGASEFCSLPASIDFRHSFACVATAPSTRNLRATLILEEKVFDDFFVANLHPIRAAALQ